jgi:hypothetical protein
MQCRAENCIRHLRNPSKCPTQPQSVRDKAHDECVTRGWIDSPSKPKSRRRNFDEYSGSSSSSAMQPGQPGPSYAPQSGPSSLLLPPLNVAHYRLASASASRSPSPFMATPLSSNPYQADFMANSISSASYPPSPASLNSSIDLGSVEESSDGASHLSKRPRTSYGYSRRASRSLSRAPSQPELPRWSSATQARFASLVARITASCGFPFLWVENPEWIAFCNEFVPGAQPISRKSLANRWIPAEAAKYRGVAKARVKGTLVTLQCDGWSGVNSHHFVAFMITTSNREVPDLSVVIKKY